jgi:hypothetical protein
VTDTVACLVLGLFGMIGILLGPLCLLRADDALRLVLGLLVLAVGAACIHRAVALAWRSRFGRTH